MSKEVVINACYGGFGLSHEAIMLYAKLKGIKLYVGLDEFSKKIYKVRTVKELLKKSIMGLGVHYFTVPPKKYYNLEKKIKKEGRNYKELNEWYFHERDIDRDDPILIKVVKKLKKKANGGCAELKIVEIPDNIEYQIEEYDGYEHIAEAHRTWD